MKLIETYRKIKTFVYFKSFRTIEYYNEIKTNIKVV